MSKTVHYKGVLIKVAYNLKDAEKHAKGFLKEHNIVYSGNSLEFLLDNYCDRYFFYKKTNTLYIISIKDEIELDEDIILAEEIGYGSVKYELKYYTDDAGFDECLGEALDKMEKDML